MARRHAENDKRTPTVQELVGSTPAPTQEQGVVYGPHDKPPTPFELALEECQGDPRAALTLLEERRRAQEDAARPVTIR